ncbi:hypothetical protein SY83_20595 [Paenibacillus swuensis]|uniref:Signal transduction protein n=1 Tax=Paenibacillus swuensis TaxID=1178515 RepID=A0A172TMN2_9BACL|nr:DUF294 nucleotidyltransferase-like domain-containing protein [Paenibacillus swuensis]ANE48288.1 hypothetical protein SY83_20595 [Paenibacillus swuensis]
MEERTEAVQLQEIEQCEHIDELRKVREWVHAHYGQGSLIAGKDVSYARGLFINKLHDAIIGRTIELSEKALADEGMGPPPVSYAFMLFGSGGRGEQTLWSDQDNGLIYEEPQPEFRSETEHYFEKLSFQVVESLQALGYPPCEGEVSASNKAWRKSKDEWKALIHVWITEGTWEQIRHLLIVADARSVYGSEILVTELKRYYMEQTETYPAIIPAMLSNTLRHKMLLNLFGSFIKEQYGEDAGSVDIKYGAYIPFVNGVRLLSLCHRVTDTSTLKRLSSLKANKAVPEQLCERWTDAFSLILELRALAAHKEEEGLYTSSGKLKIRNLSKELQDRLKLSLREGKELQKAVQKAALAYPTGRGV